MYSIVSTSSFVAIAGYLRRPERFFFLRGGRGGVAGVPEALLFPVPEPPERAEPSPLPEARELKPRSRPPRPPAERAIPDPIRCHFRTSRPSQVRWYRPPLVAAVAP